MKKTILTILVTGLMMVATAGATPYSSVVDFKDKTSSTGVTYTSITDSNSTNYVGGYSHTVTFNPIAASVQTAFLTLIYNNIDTEKEAWFIDQAGNGASIGKLLLATEQDKWTTQTFNISNLLTGVSGQSWTIGFKFNETTNGTDTFWLDKSTLAGEYTAARTVAPVPEPGTMMLLGMGMFGLAVYGKRRASKA